MTNKYINNQKIILVNNELSEENNDINKDNSNYLTFNKKFLYLFILLFYIIINLLIIFNIEFLYLREILTITFLLFIPGILILIILKINGLKLIYQITLSLGLSVSFIILFGLLINFSLPLLYITYKPMSLIPLLLSFDLVLIIMIIFSYLRLKHNTILKLKLINSSFYNTIFLIIPIFFTFLSIIGTLIINNNGTNLLSVISLILIFIYLLLVILFRNKISTSIIPYSLFFISLSLLLSISMKSNFIFGSDILHEYYVYKYVIEYNMWDVDNVIGDAYNTCLSIVILGPVLKILSNINDIYIFKIIYQIIFSFSTIVIYLFLNKFFNKTLSFLSSIYYISFPTFFIAMPMHTRQEIAFLFFFLILLILFSYNIQ